MNMIFDWGPRKEKSNIEKHGISFQEAKTVFFDENAKLIDDPDHSENEDRFILLGLSSSFRTLIVCHCYRNDEIIRIISARKATKAEKNSYLGKDHA
jgi:uncharacterized DUF497 family protein